MRSLVQVPWGNDLACFNIYFPSVIDVAYDAHPTVFVLLKRKLLTSIRINDIQFFLKTCMSVPLVHK